MTARAGELRFRVDPRDVSREKAARRLGLAEAAFVEVQDRLFARGFPRPDPDTGMFDLRAVDAWMDRRSGLTSVSIARDASAVIRERLEALGNGREGG